MHLKFVTDVYYKYRYAQQANSQVGVGGCLAASPQTEIKEKERLL
jgi:hypothetical protein